ncbi:MAG: hypothetical protein QOJ27_1766 [Sphingomonadales bacterium]|nr:hypothetical protein [Sphingomonadales bacterium]
MIERSPSKMVQSRRGATLAAPPARRGLGSGGRRGSFCAPVRPRAPAKPLARPAMTDLALEYAARAATYRRLADALKNAEDRAALLAIAEEYEREAARRRRGR